MNDYNPLLLLLWRANLDIQFIAENSLALAHYVMGYITKAEKSHLHELWDEVGSSESLYSRLWSFGVRSLRNRECGLYEASDILLGDHLTEKSQNVQWVAADQPHKCKRRLRNHDKLKELCESDPDSVTIITLIRSIQHTLLNWRMCAYIILSSGTHSLRLILLIIGNTEN